jgi:excinuclease ABC subunit A
MGPEGGAAGGEIIATGTPEQVAAEARSYTGRFVKPLLERGRAANAKRTSRGSRGRDEAASFG